VPEHSPRLNRLNMTNQITGQACALQVLRWVLDATPGGAFSDGTKRSVVVRVFEAVTVPSPQRDTALVAASSKSLKLRLGKFARVPHSKDREQVAGSGSVNNDL
jgi:hypothetical protein